MENLLKSYLKEAPGSREIICRIFGMLWPPDAISFSAVSRDASAVARSFLFAELMLSSFINRVYNRTDALASATTSKEKKEGGSMSNGHVIGTSRSSAGIINNNFSGQSGQNSQNSQNTGGTNSNATSTTSNDMNNTDNILHKIGIQDIVSPLEAFEDAWLLLARRLPSYPTGIDVASLTMEPRNIRPLVSNKSKGVDKDKVVVVYGGRKKESHKGSAVIATDDHFPCIPGTYTHPRHKSEGQLQAWERLPLVELQKTKKEGVVTRQLAPFTRVLCTGNGKTIAYLSCIAYFEVNILVNQGYRAMDDIRRFSIGIACSLFPLRKKQLGCDQYSFGYHREGSLVHANRKFAQMPPYGSGDTIGCGLVYPPLANEPIAKIFFTKNGELVGLFDMGVESLLSLPWFPALGLTPSIPMEFNFGFSRPFDFNLVDFEQENIANNFAGKSWEHYLSVCAEHEMNLYPNKYVGHPLYHNAYFSRHWALGTTNNDSNAATSENNNTSGSKNDTGLRYDLSGTKVGASYPLMTDFSDVHMDLASSVLQSPTALPVTGAGNDGTQKQYVKCLPSTSHSLYLDQDIRAATWAGINDTKRVTFQWSDASWEGSAEADGEDDGDDEDDSDLDGDSDVIMNGDTTSYGLGVKKEGANGLGTLGGGMNFPIPKEPVSDLYPGVWQPTGLRLGYGAIARDFRGSSNATGSSIDTCADTRMSSPAGNHRKASHSHRTTGHERRGHSHKGRRRDHYNSAGSNTDMDGGSEPLSRERDPRLRKHHNHNHSHSRQMNSNQAGGAIPVSGYSDGTGGSSHSMMSQLHNNFSSPINTEMAPPLSTGPPLNAMTLRDMGRFQGNMSTSDLDTIHSMRSGHSYSLDSVGVVYDGENDDEDDEDSIADSMAVEVVSVDDLGSYLGYGGNTPSESEIDDEEGDSVAATGYSRASSHSDFEAISSYRDHVRSPWGSGESSADGSLGEGMTASALGVQDSVQEDGRGNQGMALHLSHDTSTIKMRERRYSTSVDRDTDGYDGASERGGFADDIGTDVDAYEEHSQSGAVDDISKDEGELSSVTTTPFRESNTANHSLNHFQPRSSDHASSAGRSTDMNASNTLESSLFSNPFSTQHHGDSILTNSDHWPNSRVPTPAGSVNSHTSALSVPESNRSYGDSHASHASASINSTTSYGGGHQDSLSTTPVASNDGGGLYGLNSNGTASSGTRANRSLSPSADNKESKSKRRRLMNGNQEGRKES